MAPILDDSEEDCFNHLIMLEVQEFDDILSGFQLNFYFEENPYFENKKITKEYHLNSSGKIVFLTFLLIICNDWYVIIFSLV